jgi:hypothetical protein
MTFEILKFALGAVALWFALVWLGRFLGWVERSEIARQKAEAESGKAAEINSGLGAAAPARVAPASIAPEHDGIPPYHVAVIAAAVAAYGYRVVHIADAGTGRAWAAEGRRLHQTSHRTH